MRDLAFLSLGILIGVTTMILLGLWAVLDQERNKNKCRIKIGL